ncbi:MAG: hypothetical protein H0T60_13660 [Acidobacteria bacterium]|nr:hypothetical protein [Acidobacteriota bacterium]
MNTIGYRNLVLVFVLMVSATLTHGYGGNEENAARKVLNQARAAIGSDATLSGVKSFTSSWRFRRLLRNGEQSSGELQLDFLLPDKFTRNETVNLSGNTGKIITLSILNGDEAWSDVRSSSVEIPVINSGSGGAAERDILRKSLRKDYAGYLLQFLLTSAPSPAVEFTYIGEAQAEDGQADVIEVKDEKISLSMRLFFDKETHRLLLLTYREAAPRKFSLPSSGKKSFQPEQQSVPASPPDTEVQLRYADYRPEDGILVAHRITRTRNGKLDQEMELKSFKVNPPFNLDHFKVKR